MFQIDPKAWEPQRRGIEMTIDALARGKDVCLYSPTGGGKTFQAIELLRFVQSGGLGGCFYVNRTLLLSQTADRMSAAGLEYGIRAAGYDDCWHPNAPFQVCSIDTERSRVYGKGIWKLHDVGVGGLVVVDEAHIQKSETMWRVIQDYKAAGARIVLLTATPVGLSDWADELIISGKLAEYRACKALVPAVVKSIQQPDLSKVKRNATGEYVIDGKKRKIYTQSIVGDVLDRWKKYNPDARPTMLYAPGKPESVWLTERFQAAGVSWCHVDATDAIVDGERHTLTRDLWQDILGRYKDGSIKGLSCRFKLREGIDVPSTYCCILATPIGSLASYIQTIGRVLRYSDETPDTVLVIDHGGNYLRHGSPNHDRDWQAWWTLPEHAISEMHVNQIRDGKTPEPIRCPICEGERAGGRKCPHCGHEHEKSKRHVVMENGDLVERDGHLIPPRKVVHRNDTADLWAKMFWGYKNKKLKRSFAQMYGHFVHEHHYSPPRNLPFMPKEQEHWYKYPFQIEFDKLHSGRKESA
jgi:DNA repair protein RadD